MDECWPKTAIAGAIVAVHIAALEGIFHLEHNTSGSNSATSEAVFATAEIIQLQDARDKVPAPDLELETPVLDLTAPREIQLDDSIEDELAAIVSAASAPRLARVQTADPLAFARRARLPEGSAVTVLLRVEVTEDGSVSAADVVRTSHNIAADAAAIDYALETRWIPGTVERKPTKMRVSFPVTLAAQSPRPIRH